MQDEMNGSQAPVDGDKPRVLLVAGSHGFPPTQARLARLFELSIGLARRGAAVDAAVLVERALQFDEEEQLLTLKSVVRDLHIIDHPGINSPSYRIVHAACRFFLRRAWLGCHHHAPGRLIGLLRSLGAQGDYQAVIVCGPHLSRTLTAFPRWTRKIIDCPRILSDAHRDHERQGRADELELFKDPGRELDLLRASDSVLVTSAEDAVALRSRGLLADIVLVPPVGLQVSASRDPVGDRLRGSSAEEPAAPPRLLFVGSETTANLDGIRWFRRQVLPRIQKVAPTCRLRIVGEVARHIDPGPGTDRIGRVDDIEEEYAAAAVVTLPLRMGAGVHRRAVEALVRGKALCATSVGAVGIGVLPQRDAIVSDEPASLAAEVGRVLTYPEARRRIEAQSTAISRERFHPESALAPLLESLGFSGSPGDLANRPEEAGPPPYFFSPRNSHMHSS